MSTLELKPGKLSLADLRRIWAGEVTELSLDPATAPAIAASQSFAENVVNSDDSIYGINTGFGLLAKTTISAENLAKLQKNLVMSHATGTGDYLNDRVVRLILATKVIGLAHGLSGVRPTIIERLLALYNESAYPCIPEKGSVGQVATLPRLRIWWRRNSAWGASRWAGKFWKARAGSKNSSSIRSSSVPRKGSRC